MVNATVRFAEAIERLDNNTRRHKEKDDRGSDGQDGSNKNPTKKWEADKAAQAPPPTFRFRHSELQPRTKKCSYKSKYFNHTHHKTAKNPAVHLLNREWQ